MPTDHRIDRLINSLITALTSWRMLHNIWMVSQQSSQTGMVTADIYK